MRALFTGLMLVLNLLLIQSASATQPVAVGAYHFPPYVFKPESDKPSGLVPDLLQVLNAAQDDYRFTLVPTSPTRRFRDLASGRFDLILFESPNWGWAKTEHRALDLQIEDAEVYVARAEPGRDQRYFDQLEGKRMVLYSGYHYGFAKFNPDQQFLAQHLGAVLTYSHDSNLLMVLRKRADIAVITRSYLQLYLGQYPEQGAEMLVSERLDQVYEHHALFRPQCPLTPEVFAGLLQMLDRQGELESLLVRYHLTGPRADGSP